jgi:squalene-hopene/tetraprenyl-beta-curcumene cyclase
VETDQVNLAVRKATGYLDRRRRPDGSWCDRLSSSSIPTALAIIGFSRADRAGYADEIESGLAWLRLHQRADGGWSDADEDPPSSKSGTAFALAALHALDREGSRDQIRRGHEFLEAAGGVNLVPGMRGPGPKSWPAAAAIAWSIVGLRPLEQQPYQPIEVMLLPAALRNKVSIALPGVLGLGIMQAHLLEHGRLRRLLHRLAEPRALAWLRAVQGVNGGIEECPMLNALILIGLESAGVGDDIRKGCEEYLLAVRRADGSWAVDRDLEVSATTYALAALAECGDPAVSPSLRQTREWLLAAQWRESFGPLSMDPGGWAWALPSGWPESDDTAAVLLALHSLGLPRDHAAADRGLRWLVSRQNRDGSWSEWVRNGSILNDKPCPAVTAQVAMALHRYQAGGKARQKALTYLAASQTADGAFPSLWFRKHVFGTAKVLEAYAALGLAGSPPAHRARDWLLGNQRDDGSWPAGAGFSEGTVEETAWAVYALLRAGLPAADPRLARGAGWLAAAQRAGTWAPAPVGLYFDDLRYNSDLIAHTFALRALARWSAGAGHG